MGQHQIALLHAWVRNRCLPEGFAHHPAEPKGRASTPQATPHQPPPFSNRQRQAKRWAPGPWLLRRDGIIICQGILSSKYSLESSSANGRHDQPASASPAQNTAPPPPPSQSLRSEQGTVMISSADRRARGHRRGGTQGALGCNPIHPWGHAHQVWVVSSRWQAGWAHRRECLSSTRCNLGKEEWAANNRRMLPPD